MVFNFNSRGYTRMRYRGAFNCFIPLYRCLFDHRPFPMQDIEFKIFIHSKLSIVFILDG